MLFGADTLVLAGGTAWQPGGPTTPWVLLLTLVPHPVVSSGLVVFSLELGQAQRGQLPSVDSTPSKRPKLGALEKKTTLGSCLGEGHLGENVAMAEDPSSDGNSSNSQGTSSTPT